MSTVRAKFRPSRELVASVKERAKEPSAVRSRTKGDRVARLLALAHYLERLIEAGEVASYGEVARALGLTQPRVSQIMSLLFLSPAIQEWVLLGGATAGSGALQRVVRKPEWEAQVRAVSTGPFRFAPTCSLDTERDSNREQFALPLGSPHHTSAKRTTRASVRL